MFDLFHIGHLNVLARARQHCDHLIAGVVTDEKATTAKGIGPMIPLDERVAIVSAIRHVDEVVVEDTATKREMWERLHFDVIIKGDDWRGTPKGDALEAEFDPLGVEIAYVPYTQRTSSTSLRDVLERWADRE